MKNDRIMLRNTHSFFPHACTHMHDGDDFIAPFLLTLTLDYRSKKATKWTITDRHIPPSPTHTCTRIFKQANVLHLMFRTKFPLYHDMSISIVRNHLVIIPKRSHRHFEPLTSPYQVCFTTPSYQYLSSKSSNELPYALLRCDDQFLFLTMKLDKS